jgi:predicted cytidylate kinase
LIITISGRPGSGKSLVATRVASELGVRHVSAGDFMRSMAEERRVSILELSRSAEEHDAIDREIDARSARLSDEGGSFVMDARLGWRFVPQSIKVFLEVRPEVAARRIFGAARGAEHENVDLESTLEAIEARSQSETERYLSYYGIDYTDHSHYDLVIDTSDLTPGAVVGRVLEHVRSREAGQRHGLR